MKYIKKFETIQAANGVVIPNPFIGHAEGQLITNDDDNKKLEVENGIIKIVNNTQSKITPTVSFKVISEESRGNRFRVNGTQINVGSTVQWFEGDTVSIRLDYSAEKEIIQLISDSTGNVSFVFDGEDYEPMVECENLGDNILQFTNYDAQGYDFPYNLIIAETETHSELIIPCSVWCAD